MPNPTPGTLYQHTITSIKNIDGGANIIEKTTDTKQPDLGFTAWILSRTKRTQNL